MYNTNTLFSNLLFDNVILLEADGGAIWCSVGEGALNHLNVSAIILIFVFPQPATYIDCGFHEARFFNLDTV